MGGKDLWIAAHERLVERYLEEHPDADETEAYEATVDGTNEEAADMLADMIDAARERAKYEGHWPNPPTKESKGDSDG